ncbi:MAG: hypothetical protein FWF01_03525 [Alphaproteobacteria bacterium]|nr:hypothetical protein [Alphaproteobacteria bacterium]
MRNAHRILPKGDLLNELSLADMMASPIVTTTMKSYAVAQSELMKVISSTRKRAYGPQTRLPRPAKMPRT